MKNLGNLRAVSHAWAYAAEYERGKNSTHASFWFQGGELYSYNTIIAKRIPTDKGGEICLMNRGSYSNTTCKHQSLANQAFSGAKIVGAWEDANRGDRVFHKENIVVSYSYKLKRESEALAKARITSTKERFTNNVREIAVNLKKLVEFKIVKKSDLTPALKQLLLLDINPAAMALIKEAAEKQVKKEIKARSKEIKQSIADFRNHKRGNIINHARASVGGDLIRLETMHSANPTIHTSQGVTMAIEEALKLYKLCTAQIKAKGALDISARKVGHTYPINSIDAKGNAKVGCHFFKFEEIQRCYQKEYLPTLTN